MGKWGTTIIFIIIAAVLTYIIPFNSYFRNVDTMIHEFGHALVTLLLSGKVLYIHLFNDHSGVTYIEFSDSWRDIPISMAGYTMASLFTAVLFTLYARDKARVGLILLSVITLINLIFFIRNGFGVLWSIGFLAINLIMLWIPWLLVRDLYFVLIAFICLVESVIAPLYLVFTALHSPGYAGDATSLSEATFIPAVIWALVFAIIALACARVSLGQFMKEFRKSS
ncbi:M50 family metallopeptidase [Paenibacillus sp. GCM10027629]|uniref:M50 family metallopeptidase n=1 Tax=Paenibacillus sp. GCM10027629 TaxID=3273414 RepID=UPI0036331E23